MTFQSQKHISVSPVETACDSDFGRTRWRLTFGCVCACVRMRACDNIQGCASNRSCASGCRRWYSLSQTARQSHMSLFHRRRLRCQVAFIGKAPTLKLKPAKRVGWGLGVFVSEGGAHTNGQMWNSDGPEEDLMLKAAVQTLIHNSWGDAVVAEQQAPGVSHYAAACGGPT